MSYRSLYSSISKNEFDLNDTDLVNIETWATTLFRVVMNAMDPLERYRYILLQLGSAYSLRFSNVQWRDWLSLAITSGKSAGRSGLQNGLTRL